MAALPHLGGEVGKLIMNVGRNKAHMTLSVKPFGCMSPHHQPGQRQDRPRLQPQPARQLNKHRFALSVGSHLNKALQADWNRFGAEAFVFEIVEKVQPSEDPAFRLEDGLQLLEEIWIEKEQPFSGRGYNEGRRIRE